MSNFAASRMSDDNWAIWVRRYKPNTRMTRGWLAPRAIRELEMAGNRVTTDHEGRIVINATGQQRLGGC